MHRGNLLERPFQRALQLRHGTEEVWMDGFGSVVLTKAVLLQVSRIGQPPLFFMARVRLFQDRKSTRLNSSHSQISYAVFCLKKKKQQLNNNRCANHTV